MPPLAAHYALMELDDLKPSHTFRNYGPNPAWTPAELAQQRNYDGGAMQAERERMETERLNFDVLFSPATDAVNGPPVVTPDGKILGGNNRSHRIYNHYQSDGYRERLGDFLAGEGAHLELDPSALEGMKKPVLVRVA
ncbi:MAG: hypothetical protein LBV15_01605, partial [Planctomycetota bacterium]|nr:hypothetical protein [Planctomycetota bacterium]